MQLGYEWRYQPELGEVLRHEMALCETPGPFCEQATFTRKDDLLALCAEAGRGSREVELPGRLKTSRGRCPCKSRLPQRSPHPNVTRTGAQQLQPRSGSREAGPTCSAWCLKAPAHKHWPAPAHIMLHSVQAELHQGSNAQDWKGCWHLARSTSFPKLV